MVLATIGRGPSYRRWWLRDPARSRLQRKGSHMRTLSPSARQLQKLRIDLEESRAQRVHAQEDIQCIVRNARDIIIQSRELIAKVDALLAREIARGHL